ncbi:MAG: 3-isopropylmalate dehydratase small subunit [Sphingomonadaceae bacterium]|uniref:3-isopropylmalate dehydratase small subunit n=1 Tax=Thermaurantiacus sp. TaxID=2820283 RepID=UPI00298F07D3|nr:3-isopropylmalate dehydratase small subunit [Thermaurantiacus sp.]MCS6986797.1 3-isopropylmalate dehydratase small subunit [Sphingomonadaceae bacterium]MDW8413940.1 3-isopropylmalate dehydratase small subunit [Thermaurantiacus sp.]
MPEPFRRLTAAALPFWPDNVDTDVIIPSREMRGTGKTGLAAGLFANRRYRNPDTREEDPDFPLNWPEFRAARIWLAGANVGCGSSREHAAWALAEHGFRAVVAPSFNPIFFGNCVRNGIVPVVLPREVVEKLGSPVTVDLETMTVTGADGSTHPFDLPEEARTMLREGLDPVALTLKESDAIARWVEADRRRRPWAWRDLVSAPAAGPADQ